MTNFLTKLFIKNSEDTTNSTVRKSYGVLASVTGILANLFLSIIKLFAGIITSSIAITADSMNNLSDAASSVVALIGFKMSSLPPDDDHPFGHGRAEYVSGLIVSLVIILVGFELGKSSITQIFSPVDIKISTIALIIMFSSIAVKLWLYFFNYKLSKKINSLTLKATAIDSLSDVVATSAVIIGMLVTHFTSFNLDAYSGLVVSLFILYAGFNTAKETLNPLLGQPPSPDLVESIQKKVLSYKDVVGVHDLIIHNYGPNRSVISLHAEVPCDVDLVEIHDTIDTIERDIKIEFDCETVIHIDPIVTDDSVTNEMYKKILALIKLIDKRLDMHDFRMVDGKTHTNLIFDVVVPHKFRLKDEEVIQAISNAVKIIDSTFAVVITVDKAFVGK